MRLLLALMIATPALAYENPILGPIEDPDCAVIDGQFQMITPRGRGFDLRSSKDLLHWSKQKRILNQPPGYEVWQGQFLQADALYLYSAVVELGKQPEGNQVRVARAEGPKGPWTDLGLSIPGAIDPAPLMVGDQLWLYYKDDRKGQKGIWVQRMADPATPEGDPVEVLHPRPGTWEDNGYLTVEGPTVIFRGGHYFLIYSGGPFNQPFYTVGYAVADRPEGPFKRKGVLLAPSALVHSPGAADVVTDGAGQDWLVYRQRKGPQLKSPRMLTIDRLDTSRAEEGILSARATSGSEEADPTPLP